MNTSAAPTLAQAHLGSASATNSPAVGRTKPAISRWLVAVSFAIGCSSSLLASDFTTVDSVPNGWATKVTADASGNVFVAGDVSANGVTQAVISKTSDAGATWTYSALPQLSAGSHLAARSVQVIDADTGTIGTENHLVLAGISANGGHMVVRSLDGGQNWETVDFPAFSTMSEARVAVDQGGNIYVAGSITRAFTVGSGRKATTENRAFWAVRRIARDAEPGTGQSGKVTYELSETARGAVSIPDDIICAGNAVYVAGSSGGYWHVRRSGTGGAPWSVIDDFRYNANNSSAARSLAADGQGNLWVVGKGSRETIGKGANAVTPAYWITRKGVPLGNGGFSFGTVDTFELDPNQYTTAWGVAVDGADNVHVTGFARRSSSTPQSRWITRRLAAGSNSWVTTDDAGGAGHGIAADLADNIFAIGNADGVADWSVRRQLAP